MTDTPFLYSLTFFREILLEALDRAGARRIAEVGAEYGAFTQELCDHARRTGGQLITIDPTPRAQAVEFFAQHRDDPHFTFLEQTSLEALAALADIDAYIIDGDHNYYTVREELELIGARHRSDGRPLLVFEHDVEWPCGRRDWYYVPDRIPEAARQPFSREGGVGFDRSDLVPGGWGDGEGLGIALAEGGPRNGVRTAIEDFVAEHPELRFEVIPAIFGLGIIYSREAPWAPAIAELLRPFAGNPLLERMERNRTRLVCMALRELHENRKTPPVPAGYLWGPYLLEVFSVDGKPRFDRLFEQRLATRLREQEPLIPPGAEEFKLPGLCVVCGRPSLFATDYLFASPEANGHRTPVWRERQICRCGLNCRHRASYHVLTQLPGLTPGSVVFCTEPGPLFNRVRAVFPSAVAGAYQGAGVPLGRRSPDGTRNEDATRLTFADGSLDAVFTLDLLERVPDYRRALREFARCMKPGAWFVSTVPFFFERTATQPCGPFRSGVDAGADAQPPPLDGPPAGPSAKRIHDFGWDLLDEVRDAGFQEVEIALFTAPHYGYVGLQYVIAARRGPGPSGGRGTSGLEGAGHADP
jgi:SAM-dependent methyltransferase